MFHILSLAFVLILMGVFLHSAVRLVMLQQRRRARLARHRDWHGSRGTSHTSSSRSRSENSINSFTDPISEKPICVIEGGDEVVTTTPRGKNTKVVRPPPPVYGNVRGSKVRRETYVSGSLANVISENQSGNALLAQTEPISYNTDIRRSIE